MNKKNTYKYVFVGFIVIMISLAVFTYKRNSDLAEKKENREWQLKCEEYGNEKYGHITNGLDISFTSYTTKQYRFSKSLNTCIQYTETVSWKKENNIIIMFLIDMYSDETILYYFSHCTSIVGSESTKEFCTTLNDFEKKKAELFK